MAETQVTQMVGMFITVAIMLSVGVVILGNATNNCTGLTGYNSTTPSASTTGSWGLTCYNVGVQTINGYQLLGVVMIVIAAVIILAVIKYL